MNISRWSKLWNWAYWVRHRKDKKMAIVELEASAKSSLKVLIYQVKNYYEYKSDWPLIHWTQRPITTVHRKKGDCEDFAWLWHNQLKGSGYYPCVYKLYRSTWYTFGIPIWWHTIVIMVKGLDIHLFSNNYHTNIDLPTGITIGNYILTQEFNGRYCNMRRVNNVT